MTWRNCYASDALLAAVNALNPARSKASDGTIGDAAHATRTSDHNPWVVVGGVGIVRARDITRVGLDLPAIFEKLRAMGAAGDPRLAGGGYLILDRRITTPDFRGWKTYTGSNPHNHHGHVSFSRNQAGFDSRAPWALGVPAPAGGGGGGGAVGGLQRGASGDEVRRWQDFVNRMYSRFRPPLVVDGDFGQATHDRTVEVQRFLDLVPDGIVGGATRAKTGFR